MRIYTILVRRVVVITLLLVMTPSLWAQAENKTYRRAKGIEAKADRCFIRGDYQRAMKYYERANDKLPQGVDQKLSLSLKMARLYKLLQQSEEVVKYYQIVHDSADTLLSVNDVCFFVDALRQIDMNQQAEIVARRYAFTAQYSRNQRYLNTLNSLSNQRHYYGRGDSDYSVRMLDISGELPEYWIGEFKGKQFYAASHSRIQDPLKVFYHRTQYFNLDGEEQYEGFFSIPRELQSGPVAFAEDGKLMVATGMTYRHNDRIGDPSEEKGLYSTQLHYSFFDTKREGWSTFKLLFEDKSGASYAHPTFFNEGRSLMFSSNRAGGYGGMDLYMTNWDESEQAWGEPINLGPYVNTEGDEIYPRVDEGGLYFSSNGQEGFGGYDIYRVSFGHNIILPGSMCHFPYPINTTYNDFGIYFNEKAGYFISDRRGKDDIYVFDSNVSTLNSSSVVGVSAEYSAMQGNLNQITGMMKASNTEIFEKDIIKTSSYVIPKPGDIMLSVFFDFNDYQLDTKSVEKLEELLQDPALDNVDEIVAIGYGDEFGSASYNKVLSERRARTVERFLVNKGFTPKVSFEGRGQIRLTAEEYMEELHNLGKNIPTPVNHEMRKTNLTYLSFDDRVALNRKLRRVDIIVKSK